MNLDRLLRPSSIAIVGASTHAEAMGGRPLELLRQQGYSGAIYLVNPNHEVVAGRKAFRSIGEIGQPVDVALIIVPAATVLEALEDCAANQVGHAIVVSAGFGEGGESGREAEAKIRDLVAKSGLRVMGPNAQGLFDIARGVPITFSPMADLERGLTKYRSGGVSIVSQSGGLGYATFHWGSLEGLGFSYVVTTGNEVDIECLEVVDSVLDDPQTRVVLLIIEGLRRPTRLDDIAAKARRLGKYIVVAKLGKGVAGKRATVSHTAHLAGSNTAYEAAFRRAGIVEAHDQDELIDLGGALAATGPMPGRRVGIVTTSGGTGVWIADALEAEGLVVPELPSELQDDLLAVMPPYASPRNPIDLTAQVVTSGGFAATLEVLLRGRAVDGVVLVMALTRAAVLERERDEIARVLADAEVPVVVYTRTEPSEESIELLRDLGLPWTRTPRRMARLLAGLATVGELAKRPASTRADRSVAPLPNWLTQGATSTEAAAKRFLRGEGVPVPDGDLAADEHEAADIAAKIGYPVALKVQSVDLPHKTELGLVELNVADPNTLSAAYARLLARVAEFASGARVEGILVERMAQPGVEVIVGVLSDDDFGPLVMLGTGGVLTEVVNDAVFALAPLSGDDARDLVDRLRGRVLLEGFRGAEPADRSALEKLLVQVSELAYLHRDSLSEMDLNPVLVHAAGMGVTVVDALIQGKDEDGASVGAAHHE